ncbi:MAG: hypothetical protein NZO16_06745 [Deltaproteobacteria bacterium]|nr:hypothetical protein [Deltaproteobacteria bacterium]
MHVHFQEIPVAELSRFGKAKFYRSLLNLLYLVMTISLGALCLSLINFDAKLVWSVIWTTLIYMLGVGMAGPVISAILLVVKARWSAVGVRVFQSFIFVGWISFFLFWVIWVGKEVLFPWGDGSGLPGREWYMQPSFAFLRIGALLFVYLIYASWFIWREVKSDLAYITSQPGFSSDYRDWEYIQASSSRETFDENNTRVYTKLCFHAPILIILYGIIMSLFGFEFIMGMDPIWYSNLFGAHYAVTSIFLALCWGALVSVNVKHSVKALSQYFDSQYFWDLGKLIFGFSMLWAYFSFSQFLVQWYGNLPEETAWLSLRTREYPWKSLMWFVFCGCFVFPFLTLLSQDVKKNFQLLLIPVGIVILSLFLERFLIVAPNVLSYRIPESFNEILVVGAGFFTAVSIVWLSTLAFLGHYPWFAFGRYLFIEKVRSGELNLVEEIN